MAKTIKIEVHDIVFLQNGSAIHVFELTACDGTVYKVLRCKTIQACEVK